MASIMGESGDIFFPKLDEERDMIPFDKIAIDLLHYLGLEPDSCQSEEEARQKSVSLNERGVILNEAQRSEGSQDQRTAHIPTDSSQAQNDTKKWPIFFFGSDTSGEKTFEEFFTEKEVLDNETFINLGVVKNSKKRSMTEIDEIFDKLHNLFESNHVTKAAIVEILKVYLPNFEHIETGKGLDSKM